MEGILIKWLPLLDENDASLTEIEVGFIKIILV